MGQNEDYSPGHSISNSSKKLLQRGGGEGQYRGDFGEGEVRAIKHIIFAKGFCLSGFHGGSVVKNPWTNAGDLGTQIRSLDGEDPPEKELATHSRILP